MQRFQPGDFWYELSSEPDESGRIVRFNRVTCRVCRHSERYHASSISNDKLRKLFVNRGWKLSKRRTGHICPDCLKPAPKTNGEHADLPPPPTDPLEDAWLKSNDEQRAAFLDKHFEQYLQQTSLEVAWDKSSGADREAWWNKFIRPKLIINQYPADLPKPAERQLDFIETEPISEPEDDEPADWWKEMMSK